MPNANEVRVGAPDQKTTGAIKHAPVGTTLPTLADIKKSGVTLNQAFKGDEYVSEDGLTLAPSVSTEAIKDWSGSVVRKILTEFDGTLSWSMISTNAEAFNIAFGAGHVTTAAPTTAHGNQVEAKLGAHLPDPEAWVFLMKDGDARMVIAVPNGQITEWEEVNFNSSDAVGWGVTLSCYPDSSGESIYVYTDDGQVLTA